MNNQAVSPAARAAHSRRSFKRRAQRWLSVATTIVLITGLLAGCAAMPMAPAGTAPSSAPAAESYSAGSMAYEAPAAAMPQDMFFEDYGVRGFVDASRDNLSTFSVDVDTGAYTVARAYVQDGFVPPPDAVRTEEFLNYFDYGYPQPDEGDTFAIAVDGAPSPFMQNRGDEDHFMMRVGLQTLTIPADERPDAKLTFVIDVSGSMDQQNRLGLAKRALYLLVDALRPTDEVAIVVYGDRASVVQEMTAATEKSTLLSAIQSLRPQGSTNAAEGIELAYAVAADNFDTEYINRVILLSDGVANVGETGPDAILAMIAEQADLGIGMVTIGMGMGNYNDTLMEQLANDGDGFYSYVDTLEEAERVFVTDLTSSLLVVARNAKIQVVFNDEVVDEYRLAGYENRKVKDDDFRDDDVDAGEVGAGHSVTALYEVELHDGAGAADPEAVVATVHLRWEEPGTGEVIEVEHPFTVGEIAPDFESAPVNLQLATVVAEYAEVLRQTEYAEDTWLGDVADELSRIRELMGDASSEAQNEVRELEQLMLLVVGMLPPSPASLED